MDPETEKMLRVILKKTEENNRLLKKMHRSILSGRVWKFVYWIIILVIAFVTYLLIKPIFESVYSTYQDVSGQVTETKEDIASFRGGIGSLFGN